MVFSEVFFNRNTNNVFKENETLIQSKLGETLTKIANSSEPLKLFYSGSIAEDLINDIKDAAKEWNIEGMSGKGGKQALNLYLNFELVLNSEIITLKDFNDYKIDTQNKVIKTDFKRGNLTLHTAPLPGTGILLSFIMKVMEKFEDLYPNGFQSLNTSVLFYHRLMETYKYAFSKRMLLGDHRFDNVTHVMAQLSSQHFIDYVHNRINDSQTYDDPNHYGAQVYMTGDKGTSHVSVIDKYGNAASVSSTVNM